MPKVREAIRIVERDGWQFQRMNGSHRIFKHPEKPGTVTIAGHPGEDVPKGTWGNILRQARLREGNR